MENGIIEILITKGYTEVEATKVVTDVLEAKRQERENYLQKYVGKRVQGDFGGISFEVIVHDVKINSVGKTQFQVKPLNGGSKMVWIDKITQD